VFVTLLAIPMLGERVTPSRTFAVFAGFVGVLIVMRPGSEVFRWASLLILGSALCYAIYQVLTRRVAQADSPETSAVYSALLGTVLATLAVPLFWTTPERIFDVLVLSSLGILGGLGHYFVARAMLNAPANIVSPFQYFQLIGAVVLGYLLFGDLPTVYTWIGAAIIVGSGLFMGWNESRRRAEPAIR
jgi:drug/metabolite transporter (DMT)-like permease